jgi:uncharacterized protein (DUF111 family)
MKKGRPALEVSALVTEAQRAVVVGALFQHSTTLGVRWAPFERTVLARSMTKVDTRYGSVAVKVAALEGQVLGATPEFDDCRKLAVRAGVPVRAVLAEATAAAARLPRPGGRK